MKKILTVAIVALTISGCDQGSMFNAIDMVPDEVRRIESKGIDMRIYEFTPITSPEMQCIFVAGSRKGGLVCFEKQTAKE